MERARFDALWRPVFEVVYSGEVATGWPFANASWRALPLGFSPNLQEEEFRLIDPILGPVSAGTVLVSQPEVGPALEVPIELPWTSASLTQTIANTVFPHLEEFRITPASGAWAWCCSNEELSVLGAPEDVLQDLIAALGGEAGARNRFFSSVTRWLPSDFVAGIAKHRNWAPT